MQAASGQGKLISSGLECIREIYMRIICNVYFDETGFSLSLACARSLCLRAPGRRETGLLWRDVLAQYGAQKGGFFCLVLSLKSRNSQHLL